MKLSEHDIPCTIFLDLTVENLHLRSSESEPFTMFLEDSSTILFSEPVSEPVPEHGSDTCSEDGADEMRLSPESTYEDHHIHPREDDSDDRERLDSG